MNNLFIRTLVILTLAAGFSFPSFAQFQIPNGDFEQWDGTGDEFEPISWSSFGTADCSLGSLVCGFATGVHHNRIAGGRPGSAGAYYLNIYADDVMGIAIANGNITLGRIHVGSSTPTDPSNYNYTSRSSSDWSHVFTATPDSIYVWMNFTAASSSSHARISTIIHGNTDFKDPNENTNSALYAGKAILEFPPTNGWEQKKIPFVYDGTASPSYIIISLTTNATPGGGSSGDALNIDDIELIYSAWLTDIKMGGTTIDGFAMNKFDYYKEYPRGTNPFMPLPSITYTKEVSDAIVSENVIMGANNSIDGAKKIIQVTAEDGVTVKTYTVHFSIWKSSDATLKAFSYTLNNGTPIPVSVPTQTPDSSIQNINILLPPGTNTAPVISAPSLTDTGARVSITQAAVPTINTKSTAILKVTAENGAIKTYNVHFSVEKSDNANLASISYTPFNGNNTPVINFHADTLNYHIALAAGTTIPPRVAATTAWAGLSPNIIQVSSLPGTASITTTAEDGTTTKVYTVHFTVALDTNTDLSWIRYGAVAISNFHADTLTYNVELPYGVTSATLSAKSSSSFASISIQNATQIPGTASITVTAQDDAYVKTYTVHFILGRNNNAQLSSLKYTLNGNQTTIPNFNPYLEKYSVALPSGTTIAPTIEYELRDPNASATVIQPISPSDTGKVIVTAENETTTITYTVAFSVLLSTDATLKEIKIDTVLLAEFSPNKYSYNIALDSAKIPTITVKTNDTNARYTIVLPEKIPGQAQIIVTAQDTTKKASYRLNLSAAASDNPDLIDLGYELDGVYYQVPDFHSDSLIYYITLPSQTTEVPVIMGQTADFGASTIITQPTSPQGAGLMVVTSYDESHSKIYHLYFSVEISNNALLDSLFYDGIYLENFHPNTFTYNITLPYPTVTSSVVSARAQSRVAVIDYRQSLKVNDSAVVHITAEDLQTTCRYVIHFTRQLSPIATLSELSYRLNGVDSTITGFNPGITSYSVFIAPETTFIPSLAFTPTDNMASVQLIKTPKQTNDTAIIRVVAENGHDSMEYCVVFERIKSSNKYLKSLSYNGIPIPNFHHDTLNYSIILPWEETQVPVIEAQPQWDSSMVYHTNPSAVFSTASVQIIAEDQMNSNTYMVTFLQGSNATLQNLTYTLSGTTYAIDNFNPNDTVYQIVLPVGTTDIPSLNYTLTDSRSTVNLSNPVQIDSSVQIEITGWDNLHKKIYQVYFKIELSTEALLSDLQINGITIDGFNSNTLDYFVEYPFGTTTFPIVSATATQPDARIDYTQINQYPQTAFIKVYAGDTNIHKTYTISFSTEAGNNTYLSDIIIDNVSINGFNKHTLFYTVELAYGTTSIPIVGAQTEDDRATFSVIQAAQINDTAKIIATAINGDKLTYYVFFQEGLNNNALALKLLIDGKELENFAPTTRNYNYTLAANYTGIPVVTAELQDANASYSVIEANQIPGQTRVEITAEDGITTFAYRINFTKSTHVANLTDNINIKLYPNPTKNILHVDLQGIESSCILQLYTIEGKEISQHLLNEKNNIINIQPLVKGFYFYKIMRSNDIIATGKFIKE